VPDKKEFIIFVLLCVIALGLGYWYGLPDKPVTNIVVANPQPTPTTPNPLKIVPNGPTGAAAIDAAIRTELIAAGSIEKVRHIDLTRKMITNVSALARLKQLEILWLPFNNLTDISALSGLTQLKRLSLENNPDLTNAQIAELQQALPKCKIFSNPTK
jgi:Leucine-rich repeat (LRR) protein